MAEWDKVIKTARLEYEKLEVQKKIDILRDDWDYLLIDELAKQFRPEAYSKLYWLITKENNIFKRAINELALVYKQAPVRKALVGETPDTVYDDIMKSTNKNTVLKALNKYTLACNHCINYISFRDGRLDYQVLNFNNADVFVSTEDYQKIIAIKYYTGLMLDADGSTPISSDGRVDYTPGRRSIGMKYNTLSYSTAYIWTADDVDNKHNEILTNDSITALKKGMVYTVKVNTNRQQEQVVKETANPYMNPDGTPCLPFVIYDRYYPVDQRFDFTTGNDLYDLTINTGVMMMLLNQLMKFQSFKQVAMTGIDTDSMPKEILIDPVQAIALGPNRQGQNPTVSILDLQTDIDRFRKVVEARGITCLSGYGISPQNYTMSAQATSGYALQISNMGKMEAREDQIEMYRQREQELFQKERIIWNHHRPDKMIDVKAELTVDFVEPSYPKSPLEIAQEYKTLKEYNVITDIDIMLEHNPDMTPEEAEAKYYANKKINEKMRISLPPLEVKENNEPDRQ
uniref:Putative portal protein n=1 Tax=viral metagenome TaxID=1070528 RepID=A0A6M3MIR8_9ZZZZ